MHHHESSPSGSCQCRKTCRCCHKGLFALGLIMGAVYGLLFAKTSGQELRTKLKKSKTPFLDFVKAGAETDLEFVEYLGEQVAKCCENKKKR